MSRHRAEVPLRVRARYGRIAVACLSFAVTAIALLGGTGVIPVQSDDKAAVNLVPTSSNQGAGVSTKATTAKSGTAAGTTKSTKTATSPTAKKQKAPAKSSSVKSARSTSGVGLPAGSGSGRRVVFSQNAQRVWLVDDTGAVLATYLVSGSLTDNLHAGSYHVYSHSRWAVGVEDSGVMQYFVRFARGNNAAIGFHSIPTKNGQPLQTFAQLGTPRSHGCIRQKLADAVRLWDFAPVGTSVVVV